jgi:hypothetical protein
LTADSKLLTDAELEAVLVVLVLDFGATVVLAVVLRGTAVTFERLMTIIGTIGIMLLDASFDPNNRPLSHLLFNNI